MAMPSGLPDGLMSIYAQLAIMYSKGNWFEIPMTHTFCGNQVLTKANLSPSKYRNAQRAIITTYRECVTLSFFYEATPSYLKTYLMQVTSIVLKLQLL